MAGELKEVEVRILRERERGIDLADVSAVLGHKDIVTTRKHYAPVLSSRLKEGERASGWRGGSRGGCPRDREVLPWLLPAGSQVVSLCGGTVELRTRDAQEALNHLRAAFGAK